MEICFSAAALFGKFPAPGFSGPVQCLPPHSCHFLKLPRADEQGVGFQLKAAVCGTDAQPMRRTGCPGNPRLGTCSLAAWG